MVNRPGQENNDRDEDDEDDEDDGNGNVDSWIPTGETISVMLIGFSRTSTAMSFVSAVLEYSGWMKILKSWFEYLNALVLKYLNSQGGGKYSKETFG